jgi:hypothetical protein
MLSRRKILILGALSIGPAVFVVIFMALFVISLIFFVIDLDIYCWMAVILSIFFYILIIPSVLVTVILIIPFTIDLIRNRPITKAKKIWWILGLIFLNIFAIPAYWYTFIRPELPERPPGLPQEV